MQAEFWGMFWGMEWGREPAASPAADTAPAAAAVTAAAAARAERGRVARDPAALSEGEELWHTIQADWQQALPVDPGREPDYTSHRRHQHHRRGPVQALYARRPAVGDWHIEVTALHVCVHHRYITLELSNIAPVGVWARALDTLAEHPPVDPT